jgi:hypothetical protein
VTETVKRTAFALQVLEFADASGRTQTLRTTPEHPFWAVNHHEFRPAGRLQPGDTFISPDGQLQTLTATESESHPDGVFVYNFTVDIAHTYFVSATKDDQPLLVHNANCATNAGPQSSSNKPSLRAHKDALAKVHDEVGKLEKGRPGKFGSPQAGTPEKGYRLDPPHPNAKPGTPEAGYHFNWWDFTGGKKNRGGRFGAIPIKE